MKVKGLARWGRFFIPIFAAQVLVLIFPIVGTEAELAITPVLTPDAGSYIETTEETEIKPIAEISPSHPVRVIIPAINLDSKVLSLGREKNGEMSVPSGKSSDVGWYKYGTVPGNIGSAVLDAHVFAAFKNLDKLAEGDEIFVITDTDQKLRFVVGRTETYRLGDLSPNTLFHQNDAKRLNLITCAGSLTADKSTYTHRHVVFATFADAV